MVALGIVIVVLAVLLGALGLWIGAQAAAPASTLVVFGNSLSVTSTTMFVLGAVTVALLWAGLRVTVFATRRRVRQGRQRREAAAAAPAPATAARPAAADPAQPASRPPARPSDPGDGLTRGPGGPDAPPGSSTR